MTIYSNPTNIQQRMSAKKYMPNLQSTGIQLTKIPESAVGVPAIQSMILYSQKDFRYWLIKTKSDQRI